MKILIVEDHPVERLLLLGMLEQCGGMEIHQASCGVTGLEKISQTGRFDIVICDIRMPDMDGLEFLRRAGQYQAIGGVILYSDIDKDLRDTVEMMVRLHGMHFLGDLGKPLEMSALQRCLAYHVALQKPVTEVRSRTQPLLTRQQMEAAIEGGEFILHYQPKVSMDSGSCCGAEALVRWQHPLHGLLGPQLFLEQVESEGLLNRMFLSIFDQGLAFVGNRFADDHFQLAFNLNPSQLASSTLVQDIENILRKHHFPAANVMMEITEISEVDMPELCLENLIRLRLLGCKLGIDDFGVGYSSMQRLATIPFNQVKLDKSLVQTANLNPRYRGVVESILTLATSMAMEVVVEGIETEAQHRFMRKLGAQVAQGYLYSRPLNGQDFLLWMQQNRQADAAA